MTILIRTALFYAVAAVVIGAVAVSAPQVEVKWRNRTLPLPRLFAFAIFGLCWPRTFWQIVFPARPKESA